MLKKNGVGRRTKEAEQVPEEQKDDVMLFYWDEIPPWIRTGDGWGVCTALHPAQMSCWVPEQLLLLCDKFQWHWHLFPCARISVWLRTSRRIFVQLLVPSHPASSQNQGMFFCWTWVNLQSLMSGNGSSKMTESQGMLCPPASNRGTAAAATAKHQNLGVSLILKVEGFFSGREFFVFWKNIGIFLFLLEA